MLTVVLGPAGVEVEKIKAKLGTAKYSASRGIMQKVEGAAIGDDIDQALAEQQVITGVGQSISQFPITVTVSRGRTLRHGPGGQAYLGHKQLIIALCDEIAVTLIRVSDLASKVQMNNLDKLPDYLEDRAVLRMTFPVCRLKKHEVLFVPFGVLALTASTTEEDAIYATIPFINKAPEESTNITDVDLVRTCMTRWLKAVGEKDGWNTVAAQYVSMAS